MDSTICSKWFNFYQINPNYKANYYSDKNTIVLKRLYTAFFSFKTKLLSFPRFMTPLIKNQVRTSNPDRKCSSPSRRTSAPSRVSDLQNFQRRNVERRNVDKPIRRCRTTRPTPRSNLEVPIPFFRRSVRPDEAECRLLRLRLRRFENSTTSLFDVSSSDIRRSTIRR